MKAATFSRPWIPPITARCRSTDISRRFQLQSPPLCWLFSACENRNKKFPSQPTRQMRQLNPPRKMKFPPPREYCCNDGGTPSTAHFRRGLAAHADLPARLARRLDAHRQFQARARQSRPIYGNHLSTHARRGPWTITRPTWKRRSRKKASPAAGCSANPTAHRSCGRCWRGRAFKSKASSLPVVLSAIPIRAGVRLAARCARGISLSLLTRIMFGYAKLARFRYRRSPETMANIHEFIARRTELDRQAAVHRLRLIAASDFCDIAKTAKVPIFAITGALDPVVPWMFVRSWLRRNCPALREYKIIWRADHNVLSTAAGKSSDQVMKWINSIQHPPKQVTADVEALTKPLRRSAFGVQCSMFSHRRFRHSFKLSQPKNRL